MINRIKARGTISPEQFVDTALDLMGPSRLGDRAVRSCWYAREGGQLNWANAAQAEERVGQMLQLVVATREYQFN